MHTDFAEKCGKDESYAMFRYLSRNETLHNVMSTDEELLQEIIDRLKIQLLKDIENLPSIEEYEDYRYKDRFPEYTKAIEAMADKYKSVNGGFRKLALVPLFMLALVMASRVQRHFVHASWFRVTPLLKMVDVHGGVSAGFAMGIRKLTKEPSFWPSFLSREWKCWVSSPAPRSPRWISRRSRRCVKT